MGWSVVCDTHLLLDSDNLPGVTPPTVFKAIFSNVYRCLDYGLSMCITFFMIFRLLLDTFQHFELSHFFRVKYNETVYVVGPL